jgi:hypothetical protein
MLSRFDRVVSVSEEQATHIKRLGVPENHILVIPAFIPPAPEPDRRIETAIEKLRAGSTGSVMLLSGYGLPYYGYDTVIEALARIPEGDRPSVVVCDYGIIDAAYMESVAQKLKQVTSALFFRNLDPPVFAYLLSLCDLYVRATDRDGDAVAIREAAYLGKRIVASDAVARPNGTLLFKTNDPRDLERALHTIAHDATTGRIQFDWFAGRDRMIGLYADLVSD